VVEPVSFLGHGNDGATFVCQFSSHEASAGTPIVIACVTPEVVEAYRAL
jgi:hypothetical protein